MLETFDISDDQYYDPEFYSFASYDIVEANYPLIGEVISIFNSIENTLNDDLVELINQDIDTIGWIIISDMQFSTKFNLWKKIVSYALSLIAQPEKKDQFISEFKELSTSIQEAAVIRNKIAHADWDNINEKLFAKTKTKLAKDNNIAHGYLKINKEEFNKIIETMTQTDCLLSEFGKKLIAML